MIRLHGRRQTLLSGWTETWALVAFWRQCSSRWLEFPLHLSWYTGQSLLSPPHSGLWSTYGFALHRMNQMLIFWEYSVLTFSLCASLAETFVWRWTVDGVPACFHSVMRCFRPGLVRNIQPKLTDPLREGPVAGLLSRKHSVSCKQTHTRIQTQHNSPAHTCGTVAQQEECFTRSL